MLNLVSYLLFLSVLKIHLNGSSQGDLTINFEAPWFKQIDTFWYSRNDVKKVVILGRGPPGSCCQSCGFFFAWNPLLIIDQIQH